MSKKKATMTLKDFHGGSIPSDLPLPSAPGVIVRPTDRIGFDRQSVWGNPIGRPDQRLRPGSAGTQRNFDDKTPFLTPSSRIGRNFDEDERKPLDGGSLPRRTVSDDSIPIRVEPKPEYNDYVPVRPATTSYPGHVTEPRPRSGTQQSTVSGLGGIQTNAWGLKKESTSLALSEPKQSSWSAPDAAVKLAHASALEKVSSGRWHSKQQAEFEEKGFDPNPMLVRHVEVASPSAPVVSEPVERPKLKLLPRSKPAEIVESSFDYKQQVQQQIGETRVIVNVVESNDNHNQGKSASDNVNRVLERPKLSLKPRSQQYEQLDVEGNTIKERNSLFGGARPREYVLKERGVDDVALTSPTLSQSPTNKAKPEISARSLPSHHHHHNEKVDNTPLDHRIGKNVDGRDRRPNNNITEKSDAQRKNWRNENRQQAVAQPQPPQERPRSPETWRKPVEEPPAAPTGPRKAASAVELAQAFSRSVSDPKKADRLSSGQRGLPGRPEVPFSRLTGPQPRPQINGY